MREKSDARTIGSKNFKAPLLRKVRAISSKT